MRCSRTIPCNHAKTTANFSRSEKGNPDHFFQPKLRISQPNDVFEQEADAMANSVMGATAATSFTSLSSSNGDIQPKSMSPVSSVNSAAVSEGIIPSGGQPMDHSTRSFMEQQFNYDFSNVRIHNNEEAHQSSNNINALAYTHGQDIVFGAGQYRPETNAGKKLLAHELTHVVQQQQAQQPVVQRSVASSSQCSNSVDKAAPPKPFIFIGLADTLAKGDIGFAIMMLKMDLMTPAGGTLSGRGFDAYRNRFGDPVSSKGKFKNRFSGSVHGSLQEAQISEIKSIIGILEKAEKLLAKDIHYQCLGTGTAKVGDCSFRKCKSGDVLRTCSGVKAIAICPDFWSLAPDQREIGIIHELFHIQFGFGDRDKAPFAQTFNQRRNEPECFASLVADVNNITPFDPSCPPI